MKIKLNTESLRMKVLKQIVANASVGMSIERNLNILDYLIRFTPKMLRLKRNRRRGNKLELFELALREHKDEMIEIEYHDVNFIYDGTY